jgi:hypothetical protein
MLIMLGAGSESCAYFLSDEAPLGREWLYKVESPTDRRIVGHFCHGFSDY